jgi:hypothetical protein
MRILGANRLDRRAALAMLAGAGVLIDLPALACFTERRKRCEVLVAEPGLPDAKAGNPAIDFGIKAMGETLPDAARQAAPAPVLLGASESQSIQMLEEALIRLGPLAAIVFDFLVPLDALGRLSEKYGTPMLALLPGSGERRSSCVFTLLPADDAIASDCVEMLKVENFTPGVVGVAYAGWPGVTEAIVAKLDKLGTKGIRKGGIDAPVEALAAEIGGEGQPSAWVCVAPRTKTLQLARALSRDDKMRNKKILFVSPFVNPNQLLTDDIPSWLLASYVSPQRLDAHPVGKILAAKPAEGRDQPDPTYLVEMAFAATAWQTLGQALIAAGIEKNDTEAVEFEKICKAIASVKIESSALLLPWDGLSFDPTTNEIVGARVVALARREESIRQIWPKAG